ncbi:winged helix-turn-helix domain-containing protein [Sphingosinithalassobacter portus]|uniref:winged helix-turn-helix domain-containing protein n=1 Tax=Stakelama portus TaxID=2676234 RepID=UPI000D6E113A|nr:LysR family transcriptional regulator [Sphingosinithalassobacter portus]
MARLKLKIQIYAGPDIAFGPGKAALLEAIDRTGSISAAARALGMSYRRAWLLVDTCNRCFAAPLVETIPGGGASVTERGWAVLNSYRALERHADSLTTTADYRRISDSLPPD